MNRKFVALVAFIIAFAFAVSANARPASPAIGFSHVPQHVRTFHGPATLCRNGDRAMVRRAPNLPAFYVRDAYWHGTGAMCLQANNSPGFVVSHNPAKDSRGRVTGYPSIYRGCEWGHCTPDNTFPVRISHIKHLHSSVQTGGGRGATYNRAYDIWSGKRKVTGTQIAHPDGAELMIWNGYGGHCCWISDNAKRVRIEGVEYYAYHTVVYDHSDDQRYGGSSFHWNYIQFRRVHPSLNAKIDINDFIHRAEKMGAMRSSWWLESVNYGFEVWNGGAPMDGGKGLSVTDFRLHLSTY